MYYTFNSSEIEKEVYVGASISVESSFLCLSHVVQIDIFVTLANSSGVGLMLWIPYMGLFWRCPFLLPKSLLRDCVTFVVWGGNGFKQRMPFLHCLARYTTLFLPK